MPHAFDEQTEKAVSQLVAQHEKKKNSSTLKLAA
jgi:hypothetical protein